MSGLRTIELVLLVREFFRGMAKSVSSLWARQIQAGVKFKPVAS